MTNIWIIGTGKRDEERIKIWRDFRENNRVRIDFDIRESMYDFSQNGKSDFINNINSGRLNSLNIETGRQCWLFFHEIKNGDWVVARRGVKKVLGIGKITSGYIFNNDVNSFRHVRKVNWEWKHDEGREIEDSMPTDTVFLLKNTSNSYLAVNDLIDQAITIDIPGDLPDGDAANFLEGSTKSVLVNRYERNRNARNECIRHYINTHMWDRVRCFICSFDFEDTYGGIGEGFIHVHHKKPLHTIDEEYEVDPKADLVPVCPNCHAMLHSDTSVLEVEELKALLMND